MTLISALIAATLTAAPAPAPLHLEAEDASTTGTQVVRGREGNSGTGYVTGFDGPDDRLTFRATAPTGLYSLRIRYRSPHGQKGFVLGINGELRDGLFAGTGDRFSTHDAGLMEMKAGPNALEIRRGWGYYDIDAIELVPARVRRPRKPPKTLADPRATPAAKALLSALVDAYGERTFTGQYGLREADLIRRTTGRTPALLGGDFIEYSPSRVAFGSKPEGTTERLIQSARQGSIITMLWHWNAPKDLLNTTLTDRQGRKVDAKWYRGFYTEATTFDVRKALDDPKSEGYRLLLRDIDVIAGELKKFARAGVPVLWRPLHEAEGGWFWWGAKGPEAYKKLWRLMFLRLTQRHGLHNLIWVHTGEKPEWYPEDAYVDVVGIDVYPTRAGDPGVESWGKLLRRFDGKKLLALSEYGGVPDVDRMHRFGATWSFFATWNGEYLDKVPVEALRRTYRSPWVVTREGVGETGKAAPTRRPKGKEVRGRSVAKPAR